MLKNAGLLVLEAQLQEARECKFRKFTTTTTTTTGKKKNRNSGN
jgi:hypothetical protein